MSSWSVQLGRSSIHPDVTLGAKEQQSVTGAWRKTMLFRNGYICPRNICPLSLFLPSHIRWLIAILCLTQTCIWDVCISITLQKSEHLPPRSQSPYLVGSGPLGPPISIFTSLDVELSTPGMSSFSVCLFAKVSISATDC